METFTENLVNGNVQAVMAAVIAGLGYALVRVYKTGREDIKELVIKLETKSNKLEKEKDDRRTEVLEISTAYHADTIKMTSALGALAEAVKDLAKNGRTP